jgi:hypothetical protein
MSAPIRADFTSESLAFQKLFDDHLIDTITDHMIFGGPLGDRVDRFQKNAEIVF